MNISLVVRGIKIPSSISSHRTEQKIEFFGKKAGLFYKQIKIKPQCTIVRPPKKYFAGKRIIMRQKLKNTTITFITSYKSEIGPSIAINYNDKLRVNRMTLTVNKPPNIEVYFTSFNPLSTNDMKIFIVPSESPCKIRNIAVYRFLISFLVPEL